MALEKAQILDAFFLQNGKNIVQNSNFLHVFSNTEYV